MDDANLEKPVPELTPDRHVAMLCAVIGQLDQLKFLYQSGALGDGSEACILAAANGQLPIVEYLVAAGCDINTIAPVALPLAAANGRLEIVKYFRAQGCDIRYGNNAAIKAAAEKGHVAVVRYLHEQGADIHTCESIARRLPLLPSHRLVMEYLAANGVFAVGPILANLIRAIRSRKFSAIKKAFAALEFGALELSGYSDLLIHAATGIDDIRLLQKLYERGLDIHAEQDLALRVASELGHVAVVKYLHQNGGNIHVLNEEALRIASGLGHVAVVKYLHQNGGDIHVLKEEALKAAVEAGQLATVVYLVTQGADISCINSVSLALVQLNRHSPILAYLTGCGVDAIATSRATITAMHEELYSAAAIYRPSKLWEFFNDVNMEQLRRDGIHNFKRSINQNYFNFVPQSLADPQLLRLLKWWRLRPTLSPFRIKLVDPDLIPNDRGLVPSDRRVFKFDNRSRFLPRALQDLQARFGRGVQLAYYRCLIAMLWDFTSAHDKLGLAAKLAEPRVGSPVETYIDDRIVSQDLAHSIIECNSILDEIGQLPHGAFPRIAEVGAGYGRLGYVLLQALKCQYVVFDIPPSLYVSQWYLGELFPQKRIFRFRHFARFEEIAEELSQADMAFFSANQIELMPEGYFDISINISSLHELRPDQIDNMLHQIYRITRSFVYLKQYKEYLNPHDGLRILEDAYQVPRGWRHRYYRDDAVDARFFETLVENESLSPRFDANAISSRPQATGSTENGRSKPTVSILLANYNHAQYLPTALAGICEQTHPATEIIVVDDGSTDDSVAVIEEFAARFQNIRLHKNGRNRGQHYSIQCALAAARGDYVVWASADDLLLPDFLERSLDALRKQPEAGICFSRLSVFVDGTTEQKDFTGETSGAAFEYREFGGYLSPQQLAATLRKHYVWISGNTVVARRTALLEIGGFERSLRWHADWFAYYAIALRYGACVIPETLALMRERRETYSGQGIADAVQQGRVLTAILDTIKSPKYHDLSAVFRTRPSLLSPFGVRTLFAALRKPRHWGFVWPLACWYTRRLVHLLSYTTGWRSGVRLLFRGRHVVSRAPAFCRPHVVRAVKYAVGPRIAESLRAKLSARRKISRGKP